MNNEQLEDFRNLAGATIEEGDGGYFWKYKEFTSNSEDGQVYDNPEDCIVSLVRWLTGRVEVIESVFADYREYVQNNYEVKNTKVFKAREIESYEIGLTLKETECPDCHGSGFEEDDTDICLECGGPGVIYVSID